MQAIPLSILLLVLSNVFMTFAWYAQIKIVQEVITLAVYFIFREGAGAP